MDILQDQIVSITDFRRNVGKYLDSKKPYIILKNSQIVGFYIPDHLKNKLKIFKINFES